MSCIIQLVLRNPDTVNRWYQEQYKESWEEKLIERINLVLSQATANAKLEPSAITEHEIQPLDDAALARFSLPELADADRLASSILAAPCLAGGAEPELELGIGIARGDVFRAATEARRLAALGRTGEVIVSTDTFNELPFSSRDRFGPEERGGIRRGFSTTLESCFVISPVGAVNSELRKAADDVFEIYVKPACAERQLRPVRSDREPTSTIREDLWSALKTSPMVLAYMGSPDWKPNIMLEIGYRLATGKPIVLLRTCETEASQQSPSQEVPFDLSDYQIIDLPPSDSIDTERINAAVARIAKAITQGQDEQREKEAKRQKELQAWRFGHPCATIALEFDHHTNLIQSATPEAARLFARPEGLENLDVSEVIEGLTMLMPEEQKAAFRAEQKKLISTLQDRTSEAGAVLASVPIVFEDHPDENFRERAFLPVIVRHRRKIGSLAIEVLYLDVSSATHVDEDGHFVCTLTSAENRTSLVWDRYATSYDYILPELSFYRDVRDHHVSSMSRDNVHNVLEIGAGTGNVVTRLLDKGRRVVAVDTSRAMLDTLRRKLEQRDDKNDRCLILEQTAEHLRALQSERFEGVSIMLALFAMKEPWCALEEAIRLLCPGGYLVITEPKDCFEMKPLLEQAQAELERLGKFRSLRAHWNRVMQVNQRINPQHSADPFRAERIYEILQNRGFQDIRMSDAYLGNCATIDATKGA